MQLGFGAGVLTATRNDIANGAPIRFGALQDISVDFDGELKELYAQGQVAIDARRGKMKIMGKAKMAFIDNYLMANLFFGTNAATGQYVPVYNEAHTVGTTINGTTASASASGTNVTLTAVPAGITVGTGVTDTTASGAIPAGSYITSITGSVISLSETVTNVGASDILHFGPSVAASNSGSFYADSGVFYATSGLPLIYVVGAPSQGQYSENGGVYTFNSADAGAAVLINYVWQSSMVGTTINYGNPFMGTTPKFSAQFAQYLDTNSLLLQLYSCVSNKLSLPTKLDDYVMQEFDFAAYTNRAGQTFALSLTE